MRVFLICSVRSATSEQLTAQEAYVRFLEDQGHQVHYPPRDTNQDASGIEICKQNACAIYAADEIHVFYNSESQGIHFDLGMAFMLHQILVGKGSFKPIRVAESVPYGSGKSFPRMLDEWQVDTGGVNHADVSLRISEVFEEEGCLFGEPGGCTQKGD